jgi:hypothetical protein
MSMKTFFAIAGALITGGAMLALIQAPQIAEARLSVN